MFPMKFYEYLAAGLPVVSTSLDFTKDQKKGLAIGTKAEEFTDAIHKQISHGKLTEQLKREFVGENTWVVRTKKMLDLVGSKLIK